MTYHTATKDYEALHPGDALFMFVSNMTLVPRASIVIDKSCPAQYTELIVKAVQQGWIVPVAHIQGKEATWARIRE